MLFNWLPIDVIEYIVILIHDYPTYKLLHDDDMLPSLNNRDRRKRIIDSLAYKSITDHKAGLNIIEYYVNGVTHRENDDPAFIRKLKSNGMILAQYWFYEGLLHRDNNKPAFVTMHLNGEIDEQKWYFMGLNIKCNALV